MKVFSLTILLSVLYLANFLSLKRHKVFEIANATVGYYSKANNASNQIAMWILCYNYSTWHA